MSSTFNFKKLVEATIVEAMAVPFWNREAYEWHTIQEIKSGNIASWNSYVEAVPTANSVLGEIVAYDITRVRNVMINYGYNEQQAREVMKSLVGISPVWGIYYLSVGPYQASKRAWNALAKMTGGITENCDRAEIDKRLAILRSPDLAGTEAWTVPNVGVVTYGQVAQDIEDDLQNRFSMFLKRYQAPSYEMMLKAVKNSLVLKFPKYLGVLDEKDLRFELHSAGVASMPGVTEYSGKTVKHPVFDDLSENGPLMTYLKGESEKEKIAKDKNETYVKKVDLMLSGSQVRLGPDGLQKLISSFITGEKPPIRKEILQLLASVNIQAEISSNEILDLIHLTSTSELPPTLAKLKEKNYFPRSFGKFGVALRDFFDGIADEVKMRGSAKNVLDYESAEEQSPEYQAKKKMHQEAMNEFLQKSKINAARLLGNVPLEVIENPKLAKSLGFTEMNIVKKIFASMRKYQKQARKNNDPRVIDMPDLPDSNQIIKDTHYRVGQQISDASAVKASFINFAGQREQMLSIIMQERQNVEPEVTVQELAQQVAELLNKDTVRSTPIKDAKIIQAVLSNKSRIDITLQEIEKKVSESVNKAENPELFSKIVDKEIKLRGMQFAEYIVTVLKDSGIDRDIIAKDAKRYYARLVKNPSAQLFSKSTARTGEYDGKTVEGWIYFFEKEKQVKKMTDEQLLAFYKEETNKFLKQKGKGENFENMPDLYSAMQLAEATLAGGSNLGESESEDTDVEESESSLNSVKRPGQFVDALTAANIFAPGTRNILPIEASENATSTILTEKRNNYGYTAQLKEAVKPPTPEELAVAKADAQADESEAEAEKDEDKAEKAELEKPVDSTTEPTEFPITEIPAQTTPVTPDSIPVTDITSPTTPSSITPTEQTDNFSVDEYEDKMVWETITHDAEGNELEEPREVLVNKRVLKPKQTIQTEQPVQTQPVQPVQPVQPKKTKQIKQPRKTKKNKSSNPVNPVNSIDNVSNIIENGTISVMSNTIGNLIKIARELDIEGKTKESEEVHRVIRKYINDDLNDLEKGSQ